MTLRSWPACIAGTLLAWAGTLASAAGYPERPVTVVVPFAAGGDADIATRNLQPLAQRLSGQPLVVMNRPGASGSIGSLAVKTAAPDGYTLLMARVGSQVVLPALQARPHAEALRYRDFLTVVLFVRDRGLFDDHWLYIHDPEVRTARIQNFKAWSPDLVPDPACTALGLEYFCFEHDDIWDRSDDALVRLATAEVAALALVAPGDVLGGCVERQPKAYPVYDADYAIHVAAVRDELAARFPGLHLVGRNGMHKYNNQDHAMMTAMLTVENLLAGESRWDPWRVNQDAEYIEEHGGAGASGLRLVPQRLPA